MSDTALSTTPNEPTLQSVSQEEQLEKDAGKPKIKEQKLSLQMKFTLAGGALLICSFISQQIWSQNFYSAVPAAIAVCIIGYRLFIDAIKDLMSGSPGMSSLVALAVLGAIASGGYQESAAIAFFMLISALIENRSATGAQASIEELIKITPTKAHRLKDGEEEDVEAKDLIEGDVVRVRPGDNIPADGLVLNGQSTVNQASITGESVPVDKSTDDEVFGGTINMTGIMEIKVTKAGSDTTLGRVKDLILEAEQTKTPIMRMIDQYAGWYIPTILMIVGVVLFFNIRSGKEDAFNRAIGMLVAAVPSAVILATPTAMVAALSAAARLGVLIKSVVTLEAARNLTAILFDKTGTLTTGKLSVTRLSPVDGIEAVDLLRTAACVEAYSRHPVAKAVTEMGRKAKLEFVGVENFEEVAGRGVRCQLEGQTVIIGRATWVSSEEECGVQIPQDDIAIIDETTKDGSDAEGLSVLYVLRDGRLLGWIGLEDNARLEAPMAMDKLRNIGLKRMIILTGDRKSVAKRVAAQMHIPEFKAEVLPHQKLEMVDELQDRGHKVAVVGDGVNDAPALAAGDISIAMGAAGSDVAIKSASIALMNSNLNRIPFLIDLSRRTINVIRINMVIGMVFIIGGMSLSGAGWLNASAIAILHVVGGLLVIFNSARLVRVGEEVEREESEVLAEEKRIKRRKSTSTTRVETSKNQPAVAG